MQKSRSLYVLSCQPRSYFGPLIPRTAIDNVRELNLTDSERSWAAQNQFFVNHGRLEYYFSDRDQEAVRLELEF